MSSLTLDSSLVAEYQNHPLTQQMLLKDFVQLPGGYDCYNQFIKPRRYTLWMDKNPIVDFHQDSTGYGHDYPVASHYYAATGSYDEIEFLTTDHTPGTYVAGSKPDKPYIPLRDALNSVYAMTDMTGAIVATYDYSAYGEPRHWQDSAGTYNRFTYTGREWDPDAQMYYYRARWYKPDVARFVSRDPIWPLPGLNPYQYVSGSPTDRVDPEGLMDIEAEIAVLKKIETEAAKLIDEFTTLMMSNPNSERLFLLQGQIEQKARLYQMQSTFLKKFVLDRGGDWFVFKIGGKFMSRLIPFIGPVLLMHDVYSFYDFIRGADTNSSDCVN